MRMGAKPEYMRPEQNQGGKELWDGWEKITDRSGLEKLGEMIDAAKQRGREMQDELKHRRAKLDFSDTKGNDEVFVLRLEYANFKEEVFKMLDAYRKINSGD